VDETPQGREKAILTARSRDGHVVEQVELSLEDYYQGLHDLIDSNEYRSARGIVLIEGELFDLDGKLDQEFRNHYGEDGAYIGGRTMFADGTMNED
jgi:hypothetical protein